MDQTLCPAGNTLEVLLISFRKVIMSLQSCGIRSDPWFRRRSSLDTQGLQWRIDSKHFLMLRIKPLICSPSLGPSPRDLLDPKLTFSSVFTLQSLQFGIELGRQIFGGISVLATRSHFLQRWRLSNGSFELSCK